MAGHNEFYTHGHYPVVVGAHAKRTVADSAQFLLPFLRDGIRLLDFGCGPGSITADLAGHVGGTGQVVGVDSSPEALAIARRDATANRVKYVGASVYELPFPPAAFDVAYGHQVLQHLNDPVAALREVRRVLKPGGLVAVRDADFGSMTHHPHYEELDRWLEIYYRVARSNGGEPDAGRRLSSWVRTAGFTSVAATTSSWHYTAKSERQAWAQLWSERIQLPRFADRAEQLGLETEIGSIASGWLSWANEPDGWFAFVHGEVVATKSTA
jgi:ubiquinone/menaquinone biosynthesis C-methylase UbiE